MALFCSSYIPTVAATVTRNADSMTFPFTAAPQAMTFYLRFVELGMRILGGFPSLWQIGGGGTGGWAVNTTSANYYSAYNPRGTETDSIAVASPVGGDIVEMLATLSVTGVSQLTIVVNGGAPAVGAAGSALALPQAWATPVLAFPTGRHVAFRQAYIVRGVQTLATMQRLAAVN